MRVKMSLHVIGVRAFEFPNKETGEIIRGTQMFTLEPMTGDEKLIAGFQPGKVRCADSGVVAQLKSVTFPAIIECDCELNINGKGEARVMVHAVNLSASKLKAA